MIVSTPKQHARNKDNLNLADDLYHYAQTTPQALALFCENKHYSYLSLANSAHQVSRFLQGSEYSQTTERVGVLSARTFVSYAAVLGVLWAGHSYIPLVASQPSEHLKQRIAKADIQVLLVDQSGQERLSELALDPSIKVYFLAEQTGDIDESTAIDKTNVDESFTIFPDNNAKLSPPKPVNADKVAYIIFTSGSTGEPKGCAPSYYQVATFTDAMTQDFHFEQQDRFAQFCELAFDASVFILFSCLRVGGEVFVMPLSQRLTPLGFLKKHNISVLYIMPSVVNLMHQSHQLKGQMLDSLRLTFFGAEPLTLTTAKRWQSVAVKCRIENKYGPTESTVSCSSFQITQDLTNSLEAEISGEVSIENDCELNRDLVSIGKPLSGISMAIIDEARNIQSSNKLGEIVISGEQVLKSYWRDEQQTATSYVQLANSDKLWYLSGDFGYADEHGRFYVLGRCDNQIQLRGQRLELSFVQMLLRQASGVEEVVALPWPIKNGSVMGLVAFIEKEEIDQGYIFSHLRKKLLRSSLPNKIIALASLPRNNNGKVDRKQLTAMLDAHEFS